MTGAATWIGDACCLLVCAIATGYDLRTRRIPNLLNLWGFVLALALAFTTHMLANGPRAGFVEGVLPAFAGGAALFLAFFVIALVGAVGMGDVKLMGAVGAFLGWRLAFHVLVDVLFAGALVALVRAIAQGELGAALRNLGRGARSLVGGAGAEPTQMHPMPYAVGILLGVSWTVLGRYVPAVRFP